MSEAETVRDEITRLTGARFEIGPPPDRHPAADNFAWFIQCADLQKIGGTTYLHSVWRAGNDDIRMQSMSFGDTIDWIESAYGEEAAGRSLKMDFSGFSSPKAQMEFSKEFPLVYEQIKTYERIAERVSKKRGVHLSLRHKGSKGIIVFVLTAQISGKDPDSLSGDDIEANIKALEDAYAQVMQA
jgi:hypothetical protein